METEIKMNLKLFGALRKYGTDGAVEVVVPASCNVAGLKAKLRDQLGDELLEECAIASESRILQPSEMIPVGEILAVLPPVCGG